METGLITFDGVGFGWEIASEIAIHQILFIFIYLPLSQDHSCWGKGRKQNKKWAEIEQKVGWNRTKNQLTISLESRLVRHTPNASKGDSG